MDDIGSLRELLRTYRKSMGWTQEELAKRWNYSFETISAWERGKRSPSNQEVPRLANLLGVGADELAGALRRRELGALVREGTRGVALGPVSPGHGWGAAFETWGELLHIYRNRSEFNSAFSYPRMLEGARDVVAVGISLNAVTLNYSRDRLVAAITQGDASYRLCFLDPDGVHCAQREREEGLVEGTIAELTRINIRHMQIVQRHLAQIDARAVERLQLSTFDLPPRYNLYLVDEALMTAQTYGYGRGEDTPTLVLRKQGVGGLFDFYAAAARYTLEHATPLIPQVDARAPASLPSPVTLSALE